MSDQTTPTPSECIECLDSLMLVDVVLHFPGGVKMLSAIRSHLEAAQEALKVSDYKVTAREDRMEEALRRIAVWADAYPLQAFPEPDAAYYAKAREVLEANGMTLDRLSADAMRHVITQVGHIAKRAINDG